MQVAWPAATLIALFALAGCGGGGDEVTQRVAGLDGEPSRVARVPCPEGVPDCRSARGRIVFVEKVDPDGDGDAHFVIAERPGVTTDGLTVIDVRADLRPRPLPGPGDLIAAAGPVQTGSFGQSQIHALGLRVARRR